MKHAKTTKSLWILIPSNCSSCYFFFNLCDFDSILVLMSYFLYYSFLLSTIIGSVKVLDWGGDGVSSDAEASTLRTSFQQEVAVWHKLDHPNVTKVEVFF